MNLTNEQQHAIAELDAFLQNPEEHTFLLGGKSGVGKTTIVAHLINTLEKQQEFLRELDLPVPIDTYLLTATTNKAAEALRNQLKNIEVTTIHSLLELTVAKDYRTGRTYLRQKGANPPYFSSSDLIVIDEASMIDSDLLDVIVKTLGNSKIVLIGDPKQLLPVNDAESPIFQRLIPDRQVFINEVVRQQTITNADGEEVTHPIAALGEQYRDTVGGSVLPALSHVEGYVEIINGAAFQSKVEEYFIANETNSKILAWRNNTVESYNSYIQENKYHSATPLEGQQLILNTAAYFSKGLALPAEQTVYVDDNVCTGFHDAEKGTNTIRIKLTNHPSSPVYTARYIADRERYNLYTKQLAKEAKLNKSWSDFYAFTESVLDLRLPFASTVHKAQGSTYETVFIDYDDIMACRDRNTLARMLYVASTRASKKLYVYRK